MLQQWIDVLGKLGPLCVALAVFMANRAQTQWTNAVTRRAADVEDQKLRLALLERRLVAMEAVRAAAQDFSTHGGATPQIVHQIYEALKIAQVVYGADEERAIEEVMQNLIWWQFYDRQRERMRDRDEAKLQIAVDKMMELEEKTFDRLNAIDLALRRATKVTVVPPIAANRKLGARIHSALKALRK